MGVTHVRIFAGGKGCVMKNLIVVVALALGFAVPAMAQEWQESDLVRGRVGFMTIGKSLYDGLSPADAEDIKAGKDPNNFEIKRDRKPFLWLLIEPRYNGVECTIREIRVFDKKFRTDSGLGIGSTLGDIRKEYPGLMIDPFRGGLVATVGALSMYFHLESPVPISPARVLRALGREEGVGKTTGVTEEVTDDWRVVSITVR